MSGFIILFAVFTLGWLPIEKVYAGKLNTTDIEAANSILQRLHRLQEQKVLNDRIKKQRLEEVNNHNERVKFLHKLSQSAHDLYSPDEQKDVNDYLGNLKIVDIDDNNSNHDNNIILLQKALSLLQGVNDNKPVGLTLLQDNEVINRNKPDPLSSTQAAGNTKLTLPSLRELENKKSIPSALQVQSDNNLLPSAILEQQSKNKTIPFFAEENKDSKVVPISIWQDSGNKKPLKELISSEEHTPVLSWKGLSDVKNEKMIKRYYETDKGLDNVLEQVLTLLQQQQTKNKQNKPSIRWKSKTKGYSDGFLSDLNLKKLLTTLKEESKMKLPQDNYYRGSTYEETEENKNDIETADDNLGGYSKVFVVLDPEAVNSESNKYEANKVISKLTSWAAKLHKYWEPRMKNDEQGFRRRREYSSENHGRKRYERPMNDDARKYRANKRYRAQRAGTDL